MKTARLAFVLLLAASLAGAVPAADPERARKAKALFFDRQYAEARTAWQAVLLQSRGPEADQAAFWIARASESLGESERAFKEYGKLAFDPGPIHVREQRNTVAHFDVDAVFDRDPI